jgi:hypothetical protein
MQKASVSHGAANVVEEAQQFGVVDGSLAQLVLRASKVIDNGLIKLIDGRLDGWINYRWPLLYPVGCGDARPCWVSAQAHGVGHHRRIQGTSQPCRRHRSIAA